MEADAGVSGSLNNILHDIVRKTHHIEVCPYRFIVAWHGVLTLAFLAWPTPSRMAWHTYPCLLGMDQTNNQSRDLCVMYPPKILP